MMRDLGRHGEDLAEQHLVGQGATVLARNYRLPVGEIDLVLLDDQDLVAVEVKTRVSNAVVQPEEAVTPRKLRRVARTLAMYAFNQGLFERHWRIDVVAIEVGADGSLLRLEHIPDAYESG